MTTQHRINHLTPDQRVVVMAGQLKLMETLSIINSEKKFATHVELWGHFANLEFKVLASKKNWHRQLYRSEVSLAPRTGKDTAGWMMYFEETIKKELAMLQKFILSETVEFISVKFDDGIINIKESFDINKRKEATKYANDMEIKYNLGIGTVEIQDDIYQAAVDL